MKHHLRGVLAGLGLARGAAQPPRALACLAHCREGLSLAPDLCEYPIVTTYYHKSLSNLLFKSSFAGTYKRSNHTQGPYRLKTSIYGINSCPILVLGNTFHRDMY